MQPKKQGRRQVVHNEVIKLFCNSLVKAVKDVFYMWNYFFFAQVARRLMWER